MWFFFLATGSEIGMPCITFLRMLLWGKYCMQKTTSLTVLAVHTGENGLDCWTDTSLHFSANIIALNLRYILMFFFLSSFRNIFYVYLKKTIYEQAFKTFQKYISYLCVELQNTTFDGSCLVNLEGAIKEIGGLGSIFLLDMELQGNVRAMVFCHLLWKKCSSDREKLLKFFWGHLNNLLKQWKVRTISGNRMLLLTCSWRFLRSKRNRAIIIQKLENKFCVNLLDQTFSKLYA